MLKISKLNYDVKTINDVDNDVSNNGETKIKLKTITTAKAMKNNSKIYLLIRTFFFLKRGKMQFLSKSNHQRAGLPTVEIGRMKK